METYEEKYEKPVEDQQNGETVIRGQYLHKKTSPNYFKNRRKQRKSRITKRFRKSISKPIPIQKPNFQFFLLPFFEKLVYFFF